MEKNLDNIETFRKRDVTVHVTKDGVPADGATITVKMKRHQFMFGANCFMAGSYESEEENGAYAKLFTDIMSAATLPFYWGSYEPERGRTRSDELLKMAEWCKTNDLKAKGHPLVWHTVCPSWLTHGDDVGKLLKKRIRDIMRIFGGAVDWWDVLNEVTVSEQFDNPIAKWAVKNGKKDTVKFCVDAVMNENPKANLVLNDFNVGPPDYENLLELVQKEGVEIKAVGIQSHMHAGTWSPEDTEKIINRYKKFRLPIHFTELTVLSGRSASGINWHGTAEDNAWSVDEEDYARQAEYVERFYRQLFASPEVGAIIWWDFPDGNWLGAPAGLVTKDLRPKTAYEALKKLIKGEWATNQEGAADANGEYKLRAFFGSYEIGVRVPGSKELVVELDINKNGGTSERQDIYIRL